MITCDFASAAISFLGGFFKAYCDKKKVAKRKPVVEDSRKGNG